MGHANIAFFVPHLGCPHQCSFCNQHSISGQARVPAPKEVLETCAQQAERLPRDLTEVEIAFFGGSFTAIEGDIMEGLLEAAQYCVRRYGFAGIRCSTRPDAVEHRVMDTLRRYGMTHIELGCQSMEDEVLSLNGRGHTAQDVREASRLVRAYGMGLGHQMMVGLYGEPAYGPMMTAGELAKLKPDTVRIYPTVVIRGTRLAELMREGLYQPLTVDQAVVVCAELMAYFRQHKISVIRVGLHASESLEEDYLAGAYHPAFGELCASRLYLIKAREALLGMSPGSYNLTVHPGEISKMVGQRRGNIMALAQEGYNISVRGGSPPPGQVILTQST